MPPSDRHADPLRLDRHHERHLESKRLALGDDPISLLDALLAGGRGDSLPHALPRLVGRIDDADADGKIIALGLEDHEHHPARLRTARRLGGVLVKEDVRAREPEAPEHLEGAERLAHRGVDLVVGHGWSVLNCAMMPRASTRTAVSQAALPSAIDSAYPRAR